MVSKYLSAGTLLLQLALNPAAAVATDSSYSPPHYPSPRISGAGDWAPAYERAHAFVDQLTLVEKVNLTTGTGWQMDNCVGNVGAYPRPPRTPRRR